MVDEDIWTRMEARRAAIIKAGIDLCKQKVKEKQDVLTENRRTTETPQ
jgi:hypothetical protein